jgi:hypothetical protein
VTNKLECFRLIIILVPFLTFLGRFLFLDHFSAIQIQRVILIIIAGYGLRRSLWSAGFIASRTVLEAVAIRLAARLALGDHVRFGGVATCWK